MPDAAFQKPTVHWDQSEFEALKATWSPERIAEDKKILHEIFNLAADSPTLKEALDWAELHGVKFFIDRTVSGFAGYNVYGTGVVCIAKDCARPTAEAARILVHEIRHAWQDYHGLLRRRSPDFRSYFTNVILEEADASAFGARASDELKAAQYKKLSTKNSFHQWQLDGLQRSLADEAAYLEKAFLSYTSSSSLQFYGDALSTWFSKSLGVYTKPKTPPPVKGEVKNKEFSAQLRPLGAGIDVFNAESVSKFGQGFCDKKKNYLAGLPKEVLLKQILVPSLVETFYGAANDDQRCLVSNIRKAELQKKFGISNDELRQRVAARKQRQAYKTPQNATISIIS